MANKNHQRDRGSHRKKTQFAAIEKRGQIKDKYPQHLHVKVFLYKTNATHIHCVAVAVAASKLRLALDFNELAKKNDATVHNGLHLLFQMHIQVKKQIKIITSHSRIINYCIFFLVERVPFVVL